MHRQPLLVTDSSDNIQKAIILFGLGYQDYVAARILLLNRMLLQGAVLASTAIEKYCKGYTSLHGHNLKGHINEDFVKSLKNLPGYPSSISAGFLEFLERCYKLRYFDNIPSDFNLCIRQRQLLAELDDSFSPN